MSVDLSVCPSTSFWIFGHFSSEKWTGQPAGSLCPLYHRLPRWITTHCMWCLCAPTTAPCCRYSTLSSNILYQSIRHSFYSELNQKYTICLTMDWSRHIVSVNVCLLLPPWRWPHRWPKHVCRYCVIKLVKHSSVCVRLFKVLYYILSLKLAARFHS